MRYVNLFDEYNLSEAKKKKTQDEHFGIQDEEETPEQKKLLAEVKKRYPKGTKYKNMTHGHIDTVECDPYFVKYRGDIDLRRVSVKFGKGLVYDNGNWAEKV